MEIGWLVLLPQRRWPSVEWKWLTGVGEREKRIKFLWTQVVSSTNIISLDYSWCDALPVNAVILLYSWHGIHVPGLWNRTNTVQDPFSDRVTGQCLDTHCRIFTHSFRHTHIYLYVMYIWAHGWRLGIS